MTTPRQERADDPDRHMRSKPDPVSHSPALASSSETGIGIGGIVDNYRIEAKLGEGAMGVVYRARHLKLEKLVAMKVLPYHLTRDPRAVSRFEREMKAVGKLDHPNIVRAMDAGEVAGTHYLVMEFIEGVDLQRFVLERGPRPVKDACDLIRQAALGLAHAHQHGLIHRDIKPTNLFLTRTGRVKILDLGLARLQFEDAVSPSNRTLTVSGTIMGTPDYMAPEQWENTHTVDGRVDLYALGCTLFFLLTGHAPFEDDEHMSLLQKMRGHVEEPRPDLRSCRTRALRLSAPGEAGTVSKPNVSDIPEEVDSVYRRLLFRSPSERLGSADELAKLLAAAMVRLRTVEGPGSRQSESAIVSPENAPKPDTNQSRASSTTRSRASSRTVRLEAAAFNAARRTDLRQGNLSPDASTGFIPRMRRIGTALRRVNRKSALAAITCVAGLVLVAGATRLWTGVGSTAKGSADEPPASSQQLQTPPEASADSAAKSSEQTDSSLESMRGHAPITPDAESMSGVDRALLKRIGVEFRQETLRSAAETIQQASGINVVRIDHDGLSEEGLRDDVVVDLTASGVTVGQVLHRLLDPLDLEWIVEDDGILITTNRKSDEFLSSRVYDVRRLAMAMKQAQDSDRQRSDATLENGGNSPVASFLDLFMASQTRRSGVRDYPRTSKIQITDLKSILSIRAPVRDHEQISSALRALGRFLDGGFNRATFEVAPPWFPEEDTFAIYDELARQIPMAEFNQVPLLDAISSISSSTNLRIFIDERRLSEEGIQLTRKVSLKLKNNKVSTAFQQLFEPFGLIAIPDYGFLRVTTLHHAQRCKRTVIHDVQKISALGISDEDLLRLVRDQTSGPWIGDNKTGGQLAIPVKGCLIVRHAENVHLEIAELLKGLQKADRRMP